MQLIIMGEQGNKMKKIIAAASLALLLVAGNVYATPSTYIDMDISSTQPSASLSFDGNVGASLLGSNIAIDFLEGYGMPQNNNTQVALQNAVLNFTSGALTNTTVNNGITTWYFGSGGSINITGGSTTLGISAGSTLLTGQFSQSTVTELPNGVFTFAIVGSTFSDTKNPLIYAYFNQTDYGCTSGMNFSFLPGPSSGNAIQSNQVLSGDIVNVPNSPTPIPAAAWLLGSGLMGLFGLRRKEKI